MDIKAIKRMFTKQKILIFFVILNLLNLNMTFVYIPTSQQKSIATASLVHSSQEDKPFEILWTYVLPKGIYTPPLVGDFDHNGHPEVIIAPFRSGIHIINGSDGNTIREIKSSLQIYQPIAVGDIDGDNQSEIVAGGDKTLTAFNLDDGTELWSIESTTEFTSGPVIADLNNDGVSEVIIASVYHLYVINGGNGAIRWRFNVKDASISGIPAVGDINGDGLLEIVTGSVETTINTTCSSTNKAIYVIEGINGSLLWKYNTSCVLWNTITLGDLNNDGYLDIIFGSGDETIKAIDGHKRDLLWTFDVGSFPVMTPPALADIDSDGKLEVIAYAATLQGSSVKDIVYAINGEDGSEIWQYDLNAFTSFSPVIADFNNDSKLDVLIEDKRRLTILNGYDGAPIFSDRPENMFDYINSYFIGKFQPVLYDINSNGKIDVIIGDENFVFAIEFKEATARSYWSYVHGRPSNTRCTQLFDPDNDMLPTELEIKIGSNPYSNDTDNDKLPDGWEYMYGLNITKPDDSKADWDNDNLSNEVEVRYGTNPLSADTDGDGYPDDWEINNGYSPIRNDGGVFEFIVYYINWILLFLGFTIALIIILWPEHKEKK